MAREKRSNGRKAPPSPAPSRTKKTDRAAHKALKEQAGANQVARTTEAKLQRQDLFLHHFRQAGSVRAAAQASDISRRLHYHWLEDDADYAERFKDALDDAVDAMEEEARRRAVNGVTRNVHYQGKPVDTIMEYSDLLLIFLLKAHRPEKYRDLVQHQHAVTLLDLVPTPTGEFED